MRFFLAGLFLLLLPTLAFAQARGEVESIGFNNTYRPDCWTPMIVRLRPEGNEPGNYQIQVWQHDIDGDRPIYTRSITLNGAEQVGEQRFWMYFLPQAINKGLPDATNGGTLKDLQRELKVFLCSSSGKQITQLPMTSTILNVDPFKDYTQQPRSAKLILAISDGSEQPAWRDYENASGLLEDVEIVNLKPRDLPADPLGYEAVDSIIWLNSDPAELDKGGDHKLAALQDYVRFGGQLVICQPTTDWQKVLGFAEMLPVSVEGISTKTDLEPLRSMAQPRERDPIKFIVDSWNRPVGPYAFARATKKPRAVVDQWIDWKGDGSDKTPYLVRGAYGLGQVTWVAQDLANPAISIAATTGWPYVWDKVMGWNNDTYVIPANVSKDDVRIQPILERYRPGSPVDLGTPLVDNRALNLESRSAWYMFVAITFFILYWIVAGPGGYLYLAGKKRSGFSWFFFGAAAFVATALTVLMVKLILRGPPEIRHLSFVRVAPNQPALVYSRFGLYIPRDGDQTLQLDDTTHEGVSYVSGLAEHPQQLGDVSEFPAPADYVVPVRDLTSTDPPAITVPYRSSLKKFQSRWIGDLPERFTGSVQLDPDDGKVPLKGTLTNASARDFKDVYIAFRNDQGRPWMIYISDWPKAVTLDLKKDLGKVYLVGAEIGNAVPGEKKALSDEVAPEVSKRDVHVHGWLNYWYGHIRRGNFADAAFDDAGFGYCFPMLSLFDALPPVANIYDRLLTQWVSNRVELYRRGGRMLDASGCISAGQLVILATSSGPLPVPIEIDGNKTGGEGTTFYQFILPLAQSEK